MSCWRDTYYIYYICLFVISFAEAGNALKRFFASTHLANCTRPTSQRYKFSLLHIFALVIRCVTFDQVSTSCLRATIATLTSLTTTREVISFQTRASEDRGGGDRPDRLLPPELAVSLRSEGPGKASLGEA